MRARVVAYERRYESVEADDFYANSQAGLWARKGSWECFTWRHRRYGSVQACFTWLGLRVHGHSRPLVNLLSNVPSSILCIHYCKLWKLLTLKFRILSLYFYKCHFSNEIPYDDPVRLTMTVMTLSTTVQSQTARKGDLRFKNNSTNSVWTLLVWIFCCESHVTEDMLEDGKTLF